METLIKKILHEEDKVTLNEPLEIGDFIKVIDIGYGEGIHWTRDYKEAVDTSVVGFKRPQLYELYEVIDKTERNRKTKEFYTLLKPEDKERYNKSHAGNDKHLMEPLLFPSADMWLKVEENEVLKEHEEKREIDPPIKEGDFIIVIDQDDDRWEPSKTIPRDPSGMSGRANMIEYVKNNAPELYTKYEVGEYIPYESRWWPFEIPIWKLWKGEREEGRREWGMGQGGYEARLFPYAHTYIKAEDSEILSEERKRPPHPIWMDLDVGDEIVIVHIDKEKMERGGTEIPELYTTYIVIESYPYKAPPFYMIVDKDVVDEVKEKGQYVRKDQQGDEIILAWKGRWGPYTKILFQDKDEFIRRKN